ncbi:RNase adapter RapZ [Paraurantiacibacter namhicola]|uniref:GlmZ(SRNA)-inactivating NTPase n=1 Tax=Paraurantiacibacter namhicola TaxID=645517 RepID=A0A1C7D7R2_9SPHN|nr:RNase adapter RapZ [Paraurantiacibacter namhicola]ANU07477.1 glmZ(sRNA)-inactivating NTPase [Paraurantiacibacter namhicola]
MAPNAHDSQKRVLLVTGMLGAGKTTALKVLEDLGWETIDNFPIRLLERLVGDDGATPDGESHPLAIGFDCRTRGFVPVEIIEQVKTLSERGDVELSTLFLDCNDVELALRFDETRRRHPLAHDNPVENGIAAERELLSPLRRWADVLVDTSKFTTNDLKNHIRGIHGDDAPQPMTVTITSFGFARGMPAAADLVFDMRFLDNPHWVDDLREKTGRDAEVGEHIERDPGFGPNFARMEALLLDLLPRYAAQGKSYCTIAFGCTGGRHRSVYTAEKAAKALRDAGFSPTVRHRNLESRAAGIVEGSPLGGEMESK